MAPGAMREAGGMWLVVPWGAGRGAHQGRRAEVGAALDLPSSSPRKTCPPGRSLHRYLDKQTKESWWPWRLSRELGTQLLAGDHLPLRKWNGPRLLHLCPPEGEDWWL